MPDLNDSAKPKLDEAGLSQHDYVRAALKWQYNWIGLAGAAAFAIVSGSGLPLVLAAGLEMMYVALVPQSHPFRRLVRSWKYAEEKREHQKRLDEMYKNLTPDMRSRRDWVRGVIQAIRTNYSQLSFASQVFTAQMETKLNGLEEGYVRLLFAAHTHREYLRHLSPDQLRNEIAALEGSLSKDPQKVQEINHRRIEILQKRLAKFDKIRENCQVIDAQYAAIEDVLQLIRDQSVTMRDPQAVSDQIDHLVADVEQTEQSVREMEEIFSLAAPESDELSTTTLSQDLGQIRNRIRN